MENSPESPPQPLACRWFLRSVTAALILASTLGVFSARHQLFDLCSHFRCQYFVMLVVCAILLWRGKARLWAGVALMATIHNTALIGPYYWSTTADPSPGAGRATLSIVSFNVLTSNRRHAEVLEYLQRQNPDVLLLIEVDHHWLRDLAALNDIYPHQVMCPTEGASGIVLFSKLPITSHKLLGLGTDMFPSIWAELDHQGRTIGFLGTHPPPPVLPRIYQIRNTQLAVLAEQVRTSNLPTILAGDLNSTPWCSGFQHLIREGQLHDTALGFGVQRTWNAKLLGSWIPIDHVLTTSEFLTLRRTVGPSLGSDHHAVEAVLRLR